MLENINELSVEQKQEILVALNESLVGKWESKENRDKLLAILNYGHLFPEPEDDKSVKQLQYCLNRFEGAKAEADKIAAEQEHEQKLAKWNSDIKALEEKLDGCGDDEAMKFVAMAQPGNPIDNYIKLSEQRKEIAAELEAKKADKPVMETVGAKQPRADGSKKNSPDNPWSETLDKARFADSFFAYKGTIGKENVNHLVIPNEMLGELGLNLADDEELQGKSHVLIGIVEPIDTSKTILSTRKENGKVIHQFRREFELPATLTPNGDIRYIEYSPRGTKLAPSGLEKAIVRAFDDSQIGSRRGWIAIAMADYFQADRLVKAKFASGLGGHNQKIKGITLDRSI